MYKCLDCQTTRSDRAKCSLDLKTNLEAIVNLQLANLHVAAAAAAKFEMRMSVAKTTPKMCCSFLVPLGISPKGYMSYISLIDLSGGL